MLPVHPIQPVHEQTARPPRVMKKRSIAYIFEVIAEYQAQHQRRFPGVRSPFPRPGDSWNAINRALRFGAIVECPQFTALKSALAQRGLTPSLARLNEQYQPQRQFKRRFPDILAMINRSVGLHHRFPLRSSPFEVPGYVDTWAAIDSALIDGTIADCPLWRRHRNNMAALGVRPSLASINPAYCPVRRERRSIATIKSMIVTHMLRNAGKLPNQRAPFPGNLPPDSWKAVCKALRSGAIQPGADKSAFDAWIAQAGRNASLHTFMQCYRAELESDYVRARAKLMLTVKTKVTPMPPASVGKPARTVAFGALISQLF